MCLSLAPLWQVSQVAKKKKAKHEETSALVEPKSLREKVSNRLGDFLKVAGQARTNAITISNLSYAGELSKTLMDNANKMESVYKKAKAAVEDKSTSEKGFNQLLKQMDECEASNETLKA